MASPDERPEPQEQVTLRAEEARQGRNGLPVLRVLVAALALALVVWGLVELYGAYIAPPAQDQVGSPAGVQSDSVQDNPPAGNPPATEPAAPPAPAEQPATPAAPSD